MERIEFTLLRQSLDPQHEFGEAVNHCYWPICALFSLRSQSEVELDVAWDAARLSLTKSMDFPQTEDNECCN